MTPGQIRLPLPAGSLLSLSVAAPDEAWSSHLSRVSEKQAGPGRGQAFQFPCSIMSGSHYSPH